MKIVLNPYLHFHKQTRQAMEFYKTVFGGDLDLRTFKQLNASKDPSQDELIMHSQLEGDNGIIFMAADTTEENEYKLGTNFSMSLSGDTESEEVLTGYFNKLSEGGNIMVPLEKAMWGDTFGMCVDKLGIRWFVNIAGQPATA